MSSRSSRQRERHFLASVVFTYSYIVSGIRLLLRTLVTHTCDTWHDIYIYAMVRLAFSTGHFFGICLRLTVRTVKYLFMGDYYIMVHRVPVPVRRKKTLIVFSTALQLRFFTLAQGSRVRQQRTTHALYSRLRVPCQFADINPLHCVMLCRRLMLKNELGYQGPTGECPISRTLRKTTWFEDKQERSRSTNSVYIEHVW